MREIKHRWFHDTLEEIYFCEEVEWVLAGTENVQADDPRRASIGEPRVHPVTGIADFDFWLPLVIKNSGADLSGIKHDYISQQVQEIDMDTGQMIMVDRIIGVSQHASMDIYNQPLLPNVVEITMEEFNGNVGPLQIP